MSQAKFQKRQREKTRREKAAAKTARREQRRSEAAETEAPSSPAEQTAVLAELAALHARFADGDIEFDEFEAAKQELTARLNI